MKRVASLFLIALVAVVLPLVVSDDVTAQDQVHVTPAAEHSATDIVNGRIVSTISVELNGEMHRVSEVEISSTPKGSARGSVLVEVPGGERPDGTVVYVSHTPQLEQGELVQLALVPADHDIANGLPVAAGRDLPVFSVAHGIDGAYGLLPDGVGRAQAVGDYALTGSSWPDFSPAVDYYVNPANAGVSSANAIAGVRKAFAMWENDPASDINFNYRGTTTKSGQNLNDGQVVVSWGSYSSSWLAQASWIATGSGDIISFDVRINTKYRWSNGAAPGRYDIGTVVGHEVGHGLGLNHAPASSELMYFQISQANVKPLGSGDRSGIRALYPAAVSNPVSNGFTCNGQTVTVDLNTGRGAATNGRDVILGTRGDDEINGFGGNDVICGGLGVDKIYGGGGNDVILGGGGSDRIWGGSGADEIHGGSGADKIYGGPSADTIYGNGGQDSIWGDDGNDVIQGNWESDKIWGGTGNDVIRGAGGKDKLYGQQGNDSLFGGLNTDYLNGGSGTDVGDGQRGSDRPLISGVSGCEQLALTSSC